MEGPVFVIGLPRTGTTALSQLVAADPQFRSLRLWESGAPVPPPETATEHTDPRIAATEAGLAMMNEAFPLMQTMYHSEATTATECQDLMGMSFRTVHFDGSARVPSYMAWVTDCDMRGTYEYHRRVLRLLQWHCPPRLWHLKTPVHMFALDALLDAYPNARFLWSHRDPADGARVGVQPHPLHAQLGAATATTPPSSAPASSSAGRKRCAARWTSGHASEPNPAAGLRTSRTPICKPIRSARSRVLTKRSASTSPLTSQRALNTWARQHPPRSGRVDYDLERYGLTATEVRSAFAEYLDGFQRARPD